MPHILRTTLALGAFVVVVVAGGSLAYSARESARREGCANNLKQLALGLMNYRVTYEAFPFGTVVDADLPPDRRWSWFVGAWGFVGDGQLVLLIDRTKPRDAPENRTLRAYSRLSTPPTTLELAQIPGIICPSNPARETDGGPGLIDYVGIAGLGADAPELPKGHPRAGVFGYDRQTPTADLKDGASTTLLLAETARSYGPWTAGGPAIVRGLDPDRRPYIGPGRQFGGTHRGGAMVALADGSVRFLRETIDPRVFEALSTTDGGEEIADGWDR